MLKHKIKYQLDFKSFDQKLLATNLLSVVFELKNKLNNIKISNLRSVIPTSKRRVCVIRSPFVDKVSKEHFELKTFSTFIIIEIYAPQNFLLEKIFEKYLIDVLKLQELTVRYKKTRIVNF